MREVKSCGIILFRNKEKKQFLLMKHKDRLDLPKGHIKKHETELECALREFTEETGIKSNQISIVQDFFYKENYEASYKKFNNEKVYKSLIIFLAYLEKDSKVVPTEHTGYEWLNWSPPHNLQKNTINPLLKELGVYFTRQDLESQK